MEAVSSLVPVFIPRLATLLVRAEELKGEPLTEDEAMAIRDHAICVMLPAENAEAMTEVRGPDIDPDEYWTGWQRLRTELGRG